MTHWGCLTLVVQDAREVLKEVPLLLTGDSVKTERVKRIRQCYLGKFSDFRQQFQLTQWLLNLSCRVLVASSACYKWPPSRIDSCCWREPKCRCLPGRWQGSSRLTTALEQLYPAKQPPSHSSDDERFRFADEVQTIYRTSFVLCLTDLRSFTDTPHVSTEDASSTGPWAESLHEGTLSGPGWKSHLAKFVSPLTRRNTRYVCSRRSPCSRLLILIRSHSSILACSGWSEWIGGDRRHRAYRSSLLLRVTARLAFNCTSPVSTTDQTIWRNRRFVAGNLKPGAFFREFAKIESDAKLCRPFCESLVLRLPTSQHSLAETGRHWFTCFLNSRQSANCRELVSVTTFASEITPTTWGMYSRHHGWLDSNCPVVVQS